MSATIANAIDVKALKKSFGDVKVLRGINFSVKHGTIMALLGPNGAGKTTTIRILSTLLQSDGGRALINGFDVAEEPEEVKANIGLTGQYAAVDEYLTGAENLLMIGRLYRLSNQDAKRRSGELLKQFDLVNANNRPVKTYSGGMRRRLDLAMSLIAVPPIIFLDEPTTGLDPRSRLMMWDMIKDLAKSGTTILLTTQYMDEADNLADNIVVIDGGKVIAEGTADQLKTKVGPDRLEITIGPKSDFSQVPQLISDKTLQVDEERRTLTVANPKHGTAKFRELLQILETNGVEIENFALHRPTLDDVFLSLTGHKATKNEPTGAKGKGKGSNG